MYTSESACDAQESALALPNTCFKDTHKNNTHPFQMIDQRLTHVLPHTIQSHQGPRVVVPMCGGTLSQMSPPSHPYKFSFWAAH